MILTTKLFPPQPRPGLAPRSALVERVRAGFARPLTLVAAPAGFGKTTILAQALAAAAADAAPLSAAWLALDPEDNTPLRFWLYVAAALERAVPGLGAAAQARLQEAPPPDGQEIVATLLNAAADLPATQRVVLTLDDYHLITAPALQQQVGFLLDHLPPQLHLAILTRVDPPLALARRRARGELSELRAADLRLSAAEIGAFFQTTAGMTLPADLIAVLDQRTEGWLAGLQLAALALESAPAGAAALLDGLRVAERNLLDYLADEVLAGLEPDVQAFLLRTAILDRLNADLCAAVLNSSSVAAAESLRRIERAGLFLTALDAEAQWYRYHHLFAELLRIRLKRELSPPAIAELHRSAALWHAEHGAVDAAVRHALAAQDPDLAAAAIEARYLAAVRHVDAAALSAWLAPLPTDLLNRRPRLMLADAWRALLQLDLPKLQAYLPQLVTPSPAWEPAMRAEAALLAGRFHLFAQQTNQAQQSARAALAELPADALFLRGVAHLNLGLAQRLAGDLPAAEAELAAAVQFGRTADDAATWVTAQIALANVRQVQGDLHGAEAGLRQLCAQVAAPAGVALPLAELALINLGWLYVEQDRLNEALPLLEDGLSLARRKNSRRGILDGSTFLALTHAMRGDRTAALHSLAEAQELADQSGPGVVAAIVAERRARTHLLLGDWPAVRPWAAHVDPQQAPDELAEDVLLTYARFKLAEGAATAERQPLLAAQEVLERLQAAADGSGRLDRRLRALVLRAVVAAALHDQATARTIVHNALRLAAPGGFIRTCVNAGEGLRRLLEAERATLRRHTPEAAFAEQVLTAFGATAPAGAASPLHEPLTEREQEVLNLIAAGHSNAAIAAQLVVALTTVKAHLRNIFSKLEVASRTQAVARARELRLIE